MRRLLSSLLMSLVSAVLLTVFALPVFATEGEAPATEEVEHAEDADHAGEDDDHAEDGEGQWTGLMGSLVAGILMGGFAFFSAGTKGLDGHGDDH